MKPLSLAVCLTVTTLALQSGCQSTHKASAASPTIDAASADARIYVSGADWPFWGHSIKRSVERAEHVQAVSFKSKTGVAELNGRYVINCAHEVCWCPGLRFQW